MAYTYSTETVPKSLVKITITIPSSEIQAVRPGIVKKMLSEFEMDGFRKGHVPESVFLKVTSPLKIWDESLSEIIPSAYLEVATESKLPLIGRPQVSVTKLAVDNDAEIVVTSALEPKVTLVDYKKTAQNIYKTAEETVVTDDEVESAINDFRLARHRQDNKDSTDTSNEDQSEGTDIDPKDLPELTDDYIAQMGGQIKTVDELKSRIKSNLEHEKIHKQEEKLRLELVEALVRENEFEIPDILTDYELEKMLSQLAHDITMSGVPFDEYLKHIGKSLDEVREHMRPDAELRAKSQIILDGIAEKESITGNAETVDSEFKKLEEHYKSDPEFSPENAKAYLEQVYKNQAVFAFLEKSAGHTPHVH